MGPSTRTEFKRTKVFIDRRVQGALVRQTLCQWLLYAIAIFMVLFLWEVVAGGLTVSMQQRTSALWDRYGRLLLVVSLLAPTMVWLVIKTSHRFVGPVFSLKGALGKLAAGEKVRPLRFRSDDFWHDLAEEFNAMAEAMGMLETETSHPALRDASQTCASPSATTAATPHEEPVARAAVSVRPEAAGSLSE